MPTTVYPGDMQWLKEDDNDYSYEVKREHNRDMVVEMVGTIKVKTTREIERIRCYFSPLDSFFFLLIYSGVDMPTMLPHLSRKKAYIRHTNLLSHSERFESFSHASLCLSLGGYASLSFCFLLFWWEKQDTSRDRCTYKPQDKFLYFDIYT